MQSNNLDIFFTHVSLWCLFFDPHLTMHQINYRCMIKRWHGGAIHAMDHKVIPRPCKTCDWLLNLFQDHFGLHQGKYSKVTMEFEVPNKCIQRPTLSTYMVQHVLRWDMQKKCYGRKGRGTL
jgi:hypothetical protein